MFEKSKQKLIEIYNKRDQLRDPRMLGLVIFLVIVLLISWSGVKAIQRNYALQKQISTLTQENQVQQLKNNTVALQNEYYNTNQYLDLSARQNFGLGEPGETEVLIPKNVAMAQLAKIPQPTGTLQTTNQHQSTIERNFNAWVDFLLHRPSTGQ